MTSQREQLLMAVLDQPRDNLTMLALADCHEEEGLEAQAGLLRLAVSLREVEWPTEPDEDCTNYWHKDGHHFSDYRIKERRVQLEAINVVDSRQESPIKTLLWPNCPGWNGVGRLPGITAAWRWIRQPLFSLKYAEGFAFIERHVILCELYSCGVIDWKQRDQQQNIERWWDVCKPVIPELRSEPKTFYSWSGWQDMKDLWGLRAGTAGHAVSVMYRHERCLTHPIQEKIHKQPYEFTGEARRTTIRGLLRERTKTLSLARTYHRDLIRRFIAGNPLELGMAVYRQKKPQAQRWR